MGVYINPPDMTKEEWLAGSGYLVFGSPNFDEAKEKGQLPVCLVDNGAFTAAGVCYSKRELEDFMHPDGRSKIFFYVPLEELYKLPGMQKEIKAYQK